MSPYYFVEKLKQNSLEICRKLKRHRKSAVTRRINKSISFRNFRSLDRNKQKFMLLERRRKLKKPERKMAESGIGKNLMVITETFFHNMRLIYPKMYIV